MRLIRSRSTILSKNIKLVIIGNNIEEVLERIQRGFENQYSQYGNLKKDDIKSLDYETK